MKLTFCHPMARVLKVASMVGHLVMAGCQHYDRQPLDLQAHREAWQNRDIASEDLAAFVQRLAETGRAPAVAYNPADGLSLDEAEIVALFFNPHLRTERLRANVARASAENAGLWQDPVLAVDAARVVESVAEPWVVAASLSLTIPISGRLELEQSSARAEYQAELRRLAGEEWAVLTKLRSAWLEWSAAKLRAALTAEGLERLDALVGIVDRLETAGQIARIESRLFRLERAARANQLRVLDATVAELELDLKGLMGLRPDAPLSLEPTMALDAQSMTPEQRRQHLENANTTLARRRAEYEVAEEALQLELRKQYPDLGIGPGYATEDGQSRIGLVGAIPLPILNRNKRGIAEALARREAARAAFETEYEQAATQLAHAELQFENAQQIRASVEVDFIPLVEAQMNDARRSADLGELNTLLQLESLIRFQEVKLRLIDARLAEGLAVNRIRQLLGPMSFGPLHTEPTLTE